ncbi:hypothetical protein [Argonema antarcticum]|uniref:hypothetical protein n=1 Tax=Argonema antarcticum TaxID=2942763 RepID=UPI002010D47F|nr:hypothetical protein [Argonema antarcticum]MCL1472028.1 hypothetical protein [Argonema antarcticum A004/B2]
MARILDQQTNYTERNNGAWFCGITAIVEYINDRGKLASQNIMGFGEGQSKSEALVMAKHDLQEKASRFP